MEIILFEDEKYPNFYPISCLRSLGEIMTGRWTQKERVERWFGKSPLIYSMRAEYGDKIDYQKDNLFLNARLKEFKGLADIKSGSKVINKDDEVLAYRSDRMLSKREFEGLNTIQKENPLYEFIWDIIGDLENRLVHDLEGDPDLSQIQSPLDESIYIEDPKRIFIGSEVKIERGVIFNTQGGPIWIDNRVLIRGNTVIDGPAYIGEGCQIKPGSFLSNIGIGRVTKLSGEVEDSIFQGYANKQHFGFLGHSFIGEWINLGAGTTNSDLKNNYRPVKVIIEDKTYQTNMQFLGLLIGDHSKTAVNTSFNTGSIIGPFCNIFSQGFPPKYLPPFTWWGGDLSEYKLNKAIETARKVMKRRNIEMDAQYERKIRKLFCETKNLRKNRE
ncbi:MAG: putative sugar nucleotidyl transferase [candidate division WOR-3 bacterium]|nr:putative sugar nucleotidyl transferase [candidate division WOR-3 bacterium]